MSIICERVGKINFVYSALKVKTKISISGTIQKFVLCMPCVLRKKGFSLPDASKSVTRIGPQPPVYKRFIIKLNLSRN